MNKNISNRHSRSKYLHIGMVFYVLIFLSGFIFVGNAMTAKAAPNTYLVPADTGTPTDTPIPTDTTTATTVPTNTPPPTIAPTTPPTTVPTNTPPTTVPTNTPPTTVPTNPGVTPVVPPPPNSTTQGNTTQTTPTATATARSTATPTTIPVATTPTSSLGHNTTQTPPNTPSSGSNAGGPNVLALSLDIGTPVLLLFAGGLLWLYWRKNRRSVADAQIGSPTSIPWVSSNEMGTNNSFSQASGAFAVPSSPYPAINPLLSSSAGISVAPKTSILEQTTLPPFAELAGPLYTPGDLRPITVSLPSPSQTLFNPASYIPTSDMNPLSFETLNLPRDIAEMMKLEKTPSSHLPTAQTDKDDNILKTSSQHSATPPNPIALLIEPPDVTNDSMLENIMHQAQLGLFVIPHREQTHIQRS